MSDYIGRQFGNYRIVRELAGGSFGTVYLAEHLYLETLAAIKILHMSRGLDARARDKFLQEARVNASLQHPHIVHIIDFGFDESMPYMVMDYLPNGTLRVLHPRGTCVPEEQIVSYVNQIASALQYAHEQHVIHCDIKPENILLSSKQELILSDFGIAVVQSTLDTLSPQSPAGTPVYMAPEQIKGEPCAASDQYALGVMVYEWLCGEPPFHGPSMAVFAQHLHKTPPGLCVRLPHLTSAVEDVVLGALAKKPSQRFSSVQDFALMLQEAFYSTQQLSSDDAIEHGAHKRTLPHVRLVPIPLPSDPDTADDDATQPRLKAIRPAKEQQRTKLSASTRLVSPHPSQQRPPILIMCVSAPQDWGYLDQWETHLRPLEQAGYLSVWSERHLLAGAPRMQEINRHLEQADLLVLLLSADFFASEDCTTLMKQALLYHQNGEARIIPLLLRPVAWQESPLAPLACIPSNYHPVTEWEHQDAAFEACIQDIRHIIGRPVTPSQRQLQASASVVQKRPFQNRQRLLERVRSFWITGVFEQSLQRAPLITQRLQEQSNAVANPWYPFLHTPDTISPPLPAGTRIIDVYDNADGELLILGAPGSGKTMLLLELARDLLNRTEQDAFHPVPVVFNLSSWTMKQQSLVNWLIGELNSKYQVPRKLGQALVHADQILPLLDGLDEVTPEDRISCVKIINDYRKDHGLLSLVVCSRSADYLALTTRVLLRKAVVIQPLSDQQVNDYLTRVGEPLHALRMALHRDSSLRELTHIPLMLNILTLTYYNVPVVDVANAPSSANRIQQVFEYYVKRMLVSTERYPFQKATQWLSWLAKQMKQRNQTVFYIERMQPDWLEEHQRAHKLYPRVVFGLIVGIVGMVVLGSFWRSLLAQNSSLKEILFNNHNPILNLAYLIGLTLFLGLLDGSILGLVNGLLYKQVVKKESTSKVRWWWQQMRSRGFRSVLNGLLIGLLVGCPQGFILGYGDHTMPLSDWLLLTGIFTGILGGLLYGLVDGLLNVQVTNIRPTETLAWLWANMGRNLIKFLSLGLFCSLLADLLLGLLLWIVNKGSFLDNLSLLLQVALICGPFFAALGILLGGLTGGVSSGILDQQNLTVPNQGIRHSARYSMQVGIITLSTIVGIAMFINASFSTGYLLASFGVTFGPLIALVSALNAGGIACIQHVVLRWLLWKDKKMPWNYPRFLDYAAKHILLYKVGGGYMFVHRLLLEYFVATRE